MVYQTDEEVRTFALLGNDGSGKTTLTEALLFEIGIIKRLVGLLPEYSQRLLPGGTWEYGYSVFSTIFHV